MIRLGIISNTGDLTRNGLEDLLPPDFSWDLFESELVVLSSEVGTSKPAPAIFQVAIKRTGIEPNRCLFCTEELSHALAAQRAGMLAARLLPHPTSDIEKLVAMLIDAGLRNQTGSLESS